jgi:hypothetical protein
MSLTVRTGPRPWGCSDSRCYARLALHLVFPPDELLSADALIPSTSQNVSTSLFVFALRVMMLFCNHSIKLLL